MKKEFPDPFLKMRFWGSSKLDEIGWCWMHIQAWIWWQGILLQSQFSLFLCILKPEAYAQKLDRSKTPAQLHIMNWHPDYIIYIYDARVCAWACACACVRVCVWACGRVGVWACGRVGVWVCGCVGVWVGGCVCVCLFVCVSIILYVYCGYSGCVFGTSWVVPRTAQVLWLLWPSFTTLVPFLLSSVHRFYCLRPGLGLAAQRQDTPREEAYLKPEKCRERSSSNCVCSMIQLLTRLVFLFLAAQVAPRFHHGTLGMTLSEYGTIWRRRDMLRFAHQGHTRMQTQEPLEWFGMLN